MISKSHSHTNRKIQTLMPLPFSREAVLHSLSHFPQQRRYLRLAKTSLYTSCQIHQSLLPAKFVEGLHELVRIHEVVMPSPMEMASTTHTDLVTLRAIYNLITTFIFTNLYCLLINFESF